MRMKRIRSTGLPEVKRKCRRDPSRGVAHRYRPARLKTRLLRQVLVVGPERVVVNVRHQNRFSPISRRATGATGRADWQALKRPGVIRRQAWAGQGMENAFLVHTDDRDSDLGGN